VSVGGCSNQGCHKEEENHKPVVHERMLTPTQGDRLYYKTGGEIIVGQVLLYGPIRRCPIRKQEMSAYGHRQKKNSGRRGGRVNGL